VTEEEKREKESRMYSGVETFNPFCGCHFSCSFCYAQRIAKRQKHRCERCYKFAPHAHPERLSKKFKPGDNIFVCSMMFQSKNPLCFIAWRMYFKAPDNCVLGTTIETNRSTKEVSKAPDTEARKTWLSAIRTRKYVTIEPIMDFDHNVMVAWIKEIRPEFVYIGYNSLDSKNKHLLEPTVTKTKMLIASLEEVTEVRQKKIRPAWDETVNNV
jgi:hypothetical protein